jgi:LysM repeat protein
VRTAFLCVVGIPVVFILVTLLAQGCKREPSQQTMEQPVPPQIIETNPIPVLDTNPPPIIPTNPPPVVITNPPLGGTKYKVAKGDSFYSIGKKLGVSMKAIADANPGVDSSKLKIDQELVIPALTTTPGVATELIPAGSGEQLYTVQSGDNLTRLATRFGTTVKAIQAANNLTGTSIKVGQKLKIPAKAPAALPPAK